jgi:hypothetical protein
VDKITSLGAMRATLRIAKVMRHAELTQGDPQSRFPRSGVYGRQDVLLAGERRALGPGLRRPCFRYSG